MPPPPGGGVRPFAQKPSFLLSVMDGKQYSHFRATTENTEIINFCSTSLTGRPFAISGNSGGPRKRFKISSFCKSKILKKQLVFVALLMPRGGPGEVKRVSVLAHDFNAFQGHPKRNHQKCIDICSKITSWSHEIHRAESTKNASGFLEIELLFETTRIENVSKPTGFSCFSASSGVNGGGSRRGLREAVSGAFLAQKRNRLTAHVQEAS